MPWSNEKHKTKEQVFVGYQSTANLRFEFDFNMKEVAEMFELLSNIENITYKMVYDVKNKSQHIKECKKLAVKDGLETAKILAEAANATVKEIVEISYENNSHRYNVSYETVGIRKCSLADAIEDLGVSDILFSEEVYITVNIE